MKTSIWGREVHGDMMPCDMKFFFKQKNAMMPSPESSTTKAANGNLHSSNLSRTAGSLEKISARLLGMNLRQGLK